MYRKFRPDQTPPTELGRDRDYAIDLIPKFIIASGELIKILVHTEVTRYLDFKQIAGSYVYRDGKISKVPSNEILCDPASAEFHSTICEMEADLEDTTVRRVRHFE